jgi:hypothetical protein
MTTVTQLVHYTDTGASKHLSFCTCCTPNVEAPIYFEAYGMSIMQTIAGLKMELKFDKRLPININGLDASHITRLQKAFPNFKIELARLDRVFMRSKCDHDANAYGAPMIRKVKMN